MRNYLKPGEQQLPTQIIGSIYGSEMELPPASFNSSLQDPGIFPKCQRPADQQPQDLHSDEKQFRNYPGVEEQEITDAELAAHLEKEHIVAFDTYAELAEFVQSDEPSSTNSGL